MVLAGLEDLAALCLPNVAISEQPRLQPAHGALASRKLSGLKPLHPLPCLPKAVVSQPSSVWWPWIPGKDGNSLPWLSQHWLSCGMSPCPAPLCCCHCIPVLRDGDIFHLQFGPWEPRLLNPVPSHSQEQGVTGLGIERGSHCSVPAILGPGRGSRAWARAELRKRRIRVWSR